MIMPTPTAGLWQCIYQRRLRQLCVSEKAIEEATHQHVEYKNFMVARLPEAQANLDAKWLMDNVMAASAALARIVEASSGDVVRPEGG